MRCVVQRVSSAKVRIDGGVVGEISLGLLVLVGIGQGDTDDDVRWLAEKTVGLRIFGDADGKMNRSVVDIAGGVLVVSQFTLLASTRKGTRPSFNDAARPETAVPFYEAFVRSASNALGRPVETGRFGAMMQIELTNDGPITIVIDSKLRE